MKQLTGRERYPASGDRGAATASGSSGAATASGYSGAARRYAQLNRKNYRKHEVA